METRSGPARYQDGKKEVSGSTSVGKEMEVKYNINGY